MPYYPLFIGVVAVRDRQWEILFICHLTLVSSRSGTFHIYCIPAGI